MTLRDFDSAETAFRLKAFTWSLTGLLLGFLLGVLIVLKTGAPPLGTIALSSLGVWAAGFFGGTFISERGARAAASIYFSAGAKLPVMREFSLAESYVARGRPVEAAAEFERAAARYPGDPEPCLRLARLLRDGLGRHEDAIAWFRTAAARAAEAGDAGVVIGARRELIEIHTHRLRTPERALPELARLAAEHPGTPAAAWAEQELSAIKRLVSARELNG
jgi:tetratricopeptide (TPR) repeat protein